MKVLVFVVLALASYDAASADVYSDMNDDFLNQYTNNVYAEIVDVNKNPLFLYGEGLTFMYGSTNETVHVSTPTFTLLKDACHAVVATYLMLQFERDKKLSADAAKNLSMHASRVSACIEDLSHGKQDHYLTAKQKTDALKMMQDVVDFISQALKAGMVNSNVLLEFCRNQTATIQSFTMDATQSTVTVMLEAVKTWKEKLSDSEWKNSKAILQTVKSARHNQMALQVFLAIFNNPQEGFNVYQMTAMNGSIPLSVQEFQVGRIIVNMALGQVFFSNPWSLLSDIMGNSTMTFIKSLQQNGQLPFQPTPGKTANAHNMWATAGSECPYK
ncbi:uncharacterized protein [Oscarella lobularis]|uniref:uncharacterized protein n=1 Tax=Oscarella lobularis TaxID=121494 RepID=UPI003313EF2F